MSKKSTLAERLVIFSVFVVFAGLIVAFAISQTPRKTSDSSFVESFQYQTSSKAEVPDNVDSSNSSVTVTELININVATAEELDVLPGIGPSKAKAIIDYREQYGPFERIEDLLEVSGIGDATFEKLKDYITVK